MKTEEAAQTHAILLQFFVYHVPLQNIKYEQN